MKARDDDNWIYGINPVSEAIRSGRGIRTLYVHSPKHEHIRKIVAEAESKGIEVRVEGRDFFDRKFPKGHQCIAALAAKKRVMAIEDLMEVPEHKGEPPFFLVLDLIEDPRNFGAILRSADAAGAHGVVYQSHRSAGITPVVAKASAGALEYINLAEVVNIKHAMEKMKNADIALVGAEAGSNLTPWDVDMKAPVALVIGSEGQGLRRTVKEMCDHIVSLPMRGAVNSLNASVAAGILC